MYTSIFNLPRDCKLGTRGVGSHFFSHVYQTLPTSNVGTGGLTSFITGRQQSNAFINTDAADSFSLWDFVILKGKFKINKDYLA